MFNNFKHYQKILSPLIVILLLGLSVLAFNYYNYDSFKRAYEHGTVYEQLAAITGYERWIGAKQYVPALRKAGYEIDDYNLKMTDWVTSLTTKKLKLEILPFASGIEVRFNYTDKNRTVNVYQVLSKDMQLNGNGVYYVVDGTPHGTRIEISPEEKKEFTKVAVQEIKDMLKDVYDSMYSQE